MTGNEKPAGLKPNRIAVLKSNWKELLEEHYKSKYGSEWKDKMNNLDENFLNRLDYLAKNKVEVEAYDDPSRDSVVIFYPKELIDVKGDNVVVAATIPKTLVELKDKK